MFLKNIGNARPKNAIPNNHVTSDSRIIPLHWTSTGNNFKRKVREIEFYSSNKNMSVRYTIKYSDESCDLRVRRRKSIVVAQTFPCRISQILLSFFFFFNLTSLFGPTQRKGQEFHPSQGTQYTEKKKLNQCNRNLSQPQTA